MKPATLVISPACPKRLVSALRKAKWNFSELARRIHKETGVEVNKGTIHKLVTKGIEPREEHLRVAVFLSRHPRKPRKPRLPRPPLPVHRLWWNKLNTAEKNHKIFIAYQQAMRQNENS